MFLCVVGVCACVCMHVCVCNQFSVLYIHVCTTVITGVLPCCGYLKVTDLESFGYLMRSNSECVAIERIHCTC